MNTRMAAPFAALTISLMTASLAAGDALVAAASSPPSLSLEPLRRSDTAAKAEDRESWHDAFGARLDETVQRLRSEPESEKPGTLKVTWGHAAEPEETSFIPPAHNHSEKSDRFPGLANILQEHGLPPSLMGVVAVESGFNSQALSPKGARGLWQLMPATARRYGLTVEPLRDERTDPIKSTRAAAAYLRDLFAQFQDWPLVLAAYNAGEGRVAQALARTGARDFWTLHRHAALAGETLRYVPAVLAELTPFEFRATDRAAIALEYDWSQDKPRVPGRVLFAAIARQSSIAETE